MKASHLDVHGGIHLAVHHAGLEGHIEFRPRDGGSAGAEGLVQDDLPFVHSPEFQSLEVFGGADFLLVIGEGEEAALLHGFEKVGTGPLEKLLFCPVPVPALIKEEVSGLVVVEHEGDCGCVNFREDRGNACKGSHVDDGLVHPLLRKQLHALFLVPELAVREKFHNHFAGGPFGHEFGEVFREKVNRVVFRIRRAVVGHLDLPGSLGPQRNRKAEHRNRKKHRIPSELHLHYLLQIDMRFFFRRNCGGSGSILPHFTFSVQTGTESLLLGAAGKSLFCTP
ncbi:hypothetical protein SDC9_88069 [bioreactor metagenome]|uniref:Uncharacterized protein n=1 Tax=bioreactor metagenome TaxID=1076179 RepID=A0A644ZUZ8_9ZZZZ